MDLSRPKQPLSPPVSPKETADDPKSLPRASPRDLLPPPPSRVPDHPALKDHPVDAVPTMPSPLKHSFSPTADDFLIHQRREKEIREFHEQSERLEKMEKFKFSPLPGLPLPSPLKSLHPAACSGMDKNIGSINSIRLNLAHKLSQSQVQAADDKMSQISQSKMLVGTSLVSPLSLSSAAVSPSSSTASSTSPGEQTRSLPGAPPPQQPRFTSFFMADILNSSAAAEAANSVGAETERRRHSDGGCLF